ncbi:MAG: hypothetical protein KJ944_05540 [Alphaproteobacteria bacterium]|nr:hypothetical protein [Alphaproteobacteria bacterium]MBU1563320.1 hypothetical protein [Alphaproteobacteria bacterium]MBU2302043.1 hypothetical protein [Alphaproteobacteria bacterium]MBU2367299.1 hypothetical protein [Alphaproteobacteria bacterium]
MATERNDSGLKAVPVSLEDVKAAYEGPAVSVNRFISIPTSGGFRVAFLEFFDEGYAPEFRSAVHLSYSDMVSLRDLLTAQIERAESAGGNPSGAAEV